MGFGAFTYYAVTMASGGSLTTALDASRSWDKAYIHIPTMPSAAQVYIQASETATGTFVRVYQPTLNSSTVGTNVFTIVSNLTNAMVPIPNGLRYYKIETDVSCAGGATFYLLFGDGA
jgi:hypothetical protein